MFWLFLPNHSILSVVLGSIKTKWLYVLCWVPLHQFKLWRPSQGSTDMAACLVSIGRGRCDHGGCSFPAMVESENWKVDFYFFLSFLSSSRPDLKFYNNILYHIRENLYQNWYRTTYDGIIALSLIPQNPENTLERDWKFSARNLGRRLFTHKVQLKCQHLALLSGIHIFTWISSSIISI